MRLASLLLLLVLLPSRLSCQRPWVTPLTSAWNLADVSVHGDGAGDLLIIAAPSPVTVQSDTGTNVLYLTIARERARAWLPLARHALDSLLHSSRDLQAPRRGVSLKAEDGASLTIAYDRNTPLNRRFLLWATPNGESKGWSVYGDRESAYSLLAVLEKAVDSLPPVPPILIDPDCAYSPPRILKKPDFPSLTQRYTGGQVLLSFVVDSTGTPQDSTAFVLVSSDREYTRTVQRFLSSVRYRPAYCGGIPVAVRVQEHFGWYLSRR